MQEWQSSMNQIYIGTYDNQQPNYYGIVFPDAIKNNNLENNIKINNQNVYIAWQLASTIDSADENKNILLEVAVGHSQNNNSNLILYFFMLQNNQPKVFVSQTSNGQDIYLIETKNNQLQEGFSKIFNTQ
jgi:hypothetical protein